MSNRKIIYLVLGFILFVLAQVLIFKNLVLFNIAFCFVYVGFLLILPFEITSIPLILLGFVTGLVIDIFYDSLGIHAAASVLIMFVRTKWIKLITPRGGYEVGATPTIKVMGFEWFTIFALPLILLHHFALFYIEASGFKMFWFTFSKVIASTIFTFIILVLVQYLFYGNRRRVL